MTSPKNAASGTYHIESTVVAADSRAVYGKYSSSISTAGAERPRPRSEAAIIRHCRRINAVMPIKPAINTAYGQPAVTSRYSDSAAPTNELRRSASQYHGSHANAAMPGSHVVPHH